jgi:corrinoid protein of di/trimethylamine methyltransferase
MSSELAGALVTGEILSRMCRSIMDGAPQHAAALAQEWLQSGREPLQAINDGFIPGMRQVGEQFGCRALFLPDVMAAAEAMKAATAVLEPEIQRRGLECSVRGTVVLGTVQGDIHEIGKNLVGTLLIAAGFRVLDLGCNVPADRFAEAAEQAGAAAVGASSLLTTTMVRHREVIAAMERRNLRPRVKILVGGAPVTSKWSAEIGADGYAADAQRAVELVKRLLAPSAGGAA